MAGNNSVSIRILGLRELAFAFKVVSDEAPIAMKSGLKGIVENIAGKIAGRFPSLTGRAAGSVKPKATSRGAGISFGGSAAPYAPWLDFGGRVGRNKSIERPWMGRPGDGRYVYPTIKEEHANTNRELENLIVEVARNNGFKVR
jgi:hypothetical protein